MSTAILAEPMDDEDELEFAEDVDDGPPFADPVCDLATDGDMLVARAVENPDDAGPRLVLADWLADNGEYELEAAMRDTVVGVRNLRRIKERVEKMVKKPPSVKMLWASVVILDVCGLDVPGLSYFRGPTSSVSLLTTGIIFSTMPTSSSGTSYDVPILTTSSGGYDRFVPDTEYTGTSR